MANKSEMDLQTLAVKAKGKAYAAKCGMADGGKMQGQGLIKGPGTGTSDSVPICLPEGGEIDASKGEFIVPADTTAKVGAENLQKMVDKTHTPVKEQKFGKANGGPVTQDAWAYSGGRIAAGQPTPPVAAPVTMTTQAPAVQAPIAQAPQAPRNTAGAVLPASFGTKVGPEGIAGLAGQGAGTGLSTPNPLFGSLSLPPTAVQSIRQVPQMADGGLTDAELAKYRARFPRAPTTEGYTVREPPTTEGYSVNEPMEKAQPNAGMRADAARVARAAQVPPAVEAAPAVAPAVEATPAAQPQSTFGKVGQYAKNLGNAALGRPPEVAEPVASKASRGIPGKIAAGIGGAVAGYDMTQEGVNAGNVGAMAGAGLMMVPHPLAKVAGLALQFGAPYVQKGWDALKAQGAGNVEQPEGIPPETTPDRFSDARYDAQHGLATAKPAAPISEKGSLTEGMTPVQKSFLAKNGLTETPPLTFPGNPDGRGEYIRGGLGQALGVAPEGHGAIPGERMGGSKGPPGLDRTQYQNLGDFGSPGTQIFGRATEPGGRVNDYRGVGGGQVTPTNGVDFGFAPGQAKAWAAARDAGLGTQLQAPQYQAIPAPAFSPETLAVQEKISRATADLANARPGEKRQLQKALDALSTQHQVLSTKDNAANAVAAANAHGLNAHQDALFGHAMTLQQQRLQSNNQLAIAQGQLGLGQAQMDANFKIKKAEMDNRRSELTHQYGQEAIKENDALMDNLAGAKFPGDEAGKKQYSDVLKMLVTSRNFQGPDGKQKSFYEFNKKDRGLLMGDISKLADYNLERLRTGKPMDPMGQEADKSAGFGETLGYALRHAEPGLIGKNILYGTRRAPDGTIIKNPDLTTSFGQ